MARQAEQFMQELSTKKSPPAFDGSFLLSDAMDTRHKYQMTHYRLRIERNRANLKKREEPLMADYYKFSFMICL